MPFAGVVKGSLQRIDYRDRSDFDMEVEATATFRLLQSSKLPELFSTATRTLLSEQINAS